MLELTFNIDPYLNLFYHFQVVSSKIRVPPNEPYARLRRDMLPEKFYDEFGKLDLTLLDCQEITSMICGEGVSALGNTYQDVMDILEQGYADYLKYWNCRCPFLQKFVMSLSEMWQSNVEIFTTCMAEVTGLLWPRDKYIVSVIDALSRYSEDTNGMGMINLVDKSLILLGVDQPEFSLKVLMMELVHYLLEDSIKDLLRANGLPMHLSFFFNETLTQLVVSSFVESPSPLHYLKVLFTEIAPLGGEVSEILDYMAQEWKECKESLRVAALLEEVLRTKREDLESLDVKSLEVFFPERKRCKDEAQLQL